MLVWNDTNGATGAELTRSEAGSARWSYQQGRPGRHMPHHFQSGNLTMGGQHGAVTSVGDDRRRCRAIAIARDAAVVRRSFPGGDGGDLPWLRFHGPLMAIGHGACWFGFSDGHRIHVAARSVSNGIREAGRDGGTVSHETDGEEYSQQEGPDRHNRKLTAHPGVLGKPRLTQAMAERRLRRRRHAAFLSGGPAERPAQLTPGKVKSPSSRGLPGDGTSEADQGAV